MSQNLQNFVKFQKFQLENLVDFEKCCQTHIYLQKSEPIQPKTSNILPKICRSAVVTAAEVAKLARYSEAFPCRGEGRPACSRKWGRSASRAPRRRSAADPGERSVARGAHCSHQKTRNSSWYTGFLEQHHCTAILLRQGFCQNSTFFLAVFRVFR